MKTDKVLSRLGCGALQTVRNGVPGRRFGRSFDDNQSGPCLVASMQLRVNGPGERLRIVRDDADPAELRVHWDVGVSDHVHF